MDGRSSAWEVRVNRGWCKRCGLCVAFCPRGVLCLDQDEGLKVVDMSRCTGCLLCETHCPDFAVTVQRSDERDRVQGQVASGK